MDGEAAGARFKYLHNEVSHIRAAIKIYDNSISSDEVQENP